MGGQSFKKGDLVEVCYTGFGAEANGTRGVVKCVFGDGSVCLDRETLASTNGSYAAWPFDPGFELRDVKPARYRVGDLVEVRAGGAGEGLGGEVLEDFGTNVAFPYRVRMDVGWDGGFKARDLRLRRTSLEPAAQPHAEPASSEASVEARHEAEGLRRLRHAAQRLQSVLAAAQELRGQARPSPSLPFLLKGVQSELLEQANRLLELARDFQTETLESLHDVEEADEDVSGSEDEIPL